MLSNAIAILVAVAVVAVIVREFRHRDDPLVVCRWCGRPTANPVELDRWHTDRTGGTFAVHHWEFCSIACLRACVATQPKEDHNP
jgi:hypothetical protein